MNCNVFLLHYCLKQCLDNYIHDPEKPSIPFYWFIVFQKGGLKLFEASKNVVTMNINKKDNNI